MIKPAKPLQVKRKYYLYIFLCLLSVGSCMEKELVPVTDEEQIVRVLADLHVSEAAAQQFDVTLRDSFREVYYDQIFKIHQIEKEVFEKDLDLLKQNPSQLSTVYDKVIKLLEKDKQQKEREKE